MADKERTDVAARVSGALRGERTLTYDCGGGLRLTLTIEPAASADAFADFIIRDCKFTAERVDAVRQPPASPPPSDVPALQRFPFLPSPVSGPLRHDAVIGDHEPAGGDLVEGVSDDPPPLAVAVPAGDGDVAREHPRAVVVTAGRTDPFEDPDDPRAEEEAVAESVRVARRLSTHRNEV